jgi:hypothetical protein
VPAFFIFEKILQMQADKKQLETLLVNYFREYFPDFPVGTLAASESPDFVLTLKNRQQLGIELTRLHPGQSGWSGNEITDENRSRDLFIENVRGLVEKDLPLPMFVKFLFPNNEVIDSHLEMISAVRVAHIIRQEVKHHHPKSFFRISISALLLPKGIEQVLIVNHPALQTSLWERSNKWGTSNDILDNILYSISKKEEKLRLYQKQKLNYYWLLIFSDRLKGLKSFNIPNKLQNHQFESHFQHVYLFDLMKARIFQLV